MKTIMKQHIDGAFVESHGRELMDSVNPSTGEVIARVIQGDEEDARRPIGAAKRYGLHAYVNGADADRARRVASQFLAGRVAINGMLDDPQVLWGGFKHSSVRREFGTSGIEAFLEPRAIFE